jgi:4'-phosphopantetheinyl transferase
MKVAFKFLSDKEFEYTCNDPAKTCLYWSAKETLYKMYSRRKLLFKENLPIGPLENPEKGTLRGQVLLDNFNQTYTVHYEKTDAYILTYCIF